MSDLLLVVGPAAGAVAAALPTAKWLRAVRPTWSRSRVAGVASLPLPFAGCALATMTFVRLSLVLPRESCGLPMLGAVMLGIYSILVYAVAAAAARAWSGGASA